MVSSQQSHITATLHKVVREYLNEHVNSSIVNEHLICNISSRLEGTLLSVMGFESAKKYVRFAAAYWICTNARYFHTPARTQKLVLNDFLCRDFVLRAWDNIAERKRILINAQTYKEDGSLQEAKMLIQRFEEEYLSYAYATMLKYGDVPLEGLNPNPYWVFGVKRFGRFSKSEKDTPVVWEKIPVIYSGVYMTLMQAVSSVISLYSTDENFYHSTCQALTAARYNFACSTGALLFSPTPNGYYINKSGIDEMLLTINFEDYVAYRERLRTANKERPADEKKPNSFLKKLDTALFKAVAEWSGRSLGDGGVPINLQSVQQEFAPFGVESIDGKNFKTLDPYLRQLVQA